LLAFLVVLLAAVAHFCFMEPAEEQKLLALSVSDLKRALQERGVDYSDCVEKIVCLFFV
jgi:hypothetical protein